MKQSTRWLLVMLLPVWLTGPAAAQEKPPQAPAKPASSSPGKWMWESDEVMTLKGQPAESIPAEMRRLFKVVEDKAATGGKAVQVTIDKRMVRQTDPKKKTPAILVFRTPALNREQAPPGLYRVTARLKIAGMTNAIGTGIWFRPGSADALEPTRGGLTLHGYEFTAEDAFQEFSFLTEVVGPDLVTKRPSRYVPRGALASGTGGTKSELDALINPKPPTPEQQKAKDEADAKELDKVNKAYAAGSLQVEISVPPVVLGGFGRVENSLQSVTVDWVRIERIDEPAIVVRQVLPQKVWIRPGNEQKFHVWMHNRTVNAQTGDVKVRVTHGIGASIDAGAAKVDLAAGEFKIVTLSWPVPKDVQWGCEATAEVVVGGKAVSKASDVFSVHDSPWAVMNFGGANRDANPYAEMPHYTNYIESFGVTPGDAIKPFPDDPSVPYFGGMSNYPTHIAYQKILADRAKAIGAAPFMYLSPLATSHYAEEAYLEKPHLFFDRIVWSDQASDRWRANYADLVDRFINNKPPNPDPKAYDRYHIEVGVNAANKEIVDGYIDGIKKNMKFVGYEGVRWDGGPIEVVSTDRYGVKVGPGSPEADRKLTASEIRRMKKEIRAEFPHYTEGNNGVFGGLPSMLYNRKLDPPPLKPDEDPFVAFMEDGSSLMDEGWMNAYIFLDVRNIIKDYFWGVRQQTDYCRRAGGYLHTFSPARDGNPYFSQSTLYFNMLVALAGAQYPGKWSCPPASETGMAHFLTRFCGFLWDNKLMWLREAPDLIRVDAPHELWWEETAVWRDLPDGRRRYVIPLVNPPTIERFYKNDRFSELPEPIREAFPMEVKVPEGFKSAKATMLTAEPRTAAVPLDTTVDGGRALFDVPRLFTFQVIVVEFQK